MYRDDDFSRVRSLITELELFLGKAIEWSGLSLPPMPNSFFSRSRYATLLKLAIATAVALVRAAL